MKKLVIGLFLTTAMQWGLAQTRELPDFTDLVEKQGGAVVNVSTTQTIRSNGNAIQGFPFDQDDPAFEIFKRLFPRQPGAPGAPREYQNRSLGSGFILSADGYVLTNAHVIDAADEVVVKLNDNREFKARVIGADRLTDVALLKIDASGLPAVKIGDPSRLRVGEWVFAIGSPFGLEQTVTAGIVSAKGRSLPDDNYVPFIQTDVAINPGSSGGPLFNMKGEVVGINSQIYSRSGGYMGLAFAIPIDLAFDVQQQLRQSGKVSRGRIGVSIQEVSKDLAESFGLPKAAGALIGSVEKGGPAEKGGLLPGDVILRFDGKPISQSGDLPRIVGLTKPGSKVPVQVWRAGASKELSVLVGEMPVDEKIIANAAKRQNRNAPAAANRLGLVLRELSVEQKHSLGVAGGLLVEEVRNGAPRTDLRSGDVLLSMVVKGKQIELSSVEQFNGLLAKTGAHEIVTLWVRRGDNQIFVTIKGVASKKPQAAEETNN
ncbi:MAG TPA: DegQ family serine endoprotease [Rhodocyclaceae bacterium]|nr:DegQ family serine endoprotease [Rhodocyclaceae bacterium]